MWLFYEPIHAEVLNEMMTHTSVQILVQSMLFGTQTWVKGSSMFAHFYHNIVNDCKRIHFSKQHLELR